MSIDLDNLDDLPNALRAEATRRIDRAARALDRPSDARVHDARKQLKKARAIVRLFRGVVGKRRWRRLDRALRDAGRPLSAARDAAVLVETLDALGGRFAPLRRELVDARRAARPDVDAARAALAKAADALDLGDVAWKHVARAVARTYRDGRRAFRAAVDSDDDDAWHACRKRVKDLRYQLEWLRPIPPLSIDLARTLGDRLGDDHDLAVLRATSSLDALHERIARRQRALRADARAIGDELFAERPRDVRRRLRDAARA